MRNVIVALVVLVSVVGMSACSHFGQANLPPKTEFFVTTGDMASTEYQPVALVASDRSFCSPCGLTLDAAYAEIEESLKNDLIDKAKAAGANGIINLGVMIMPMPGLSTVRAAGLAIKY
jgi:hypothetical protein